MPSEQSSAQLQVPQSLGQDLQSSPSQRPSPQPGSSVGFEVGEGVGVGVSVALALSVGLGAGVPPPSCAIAKHGTAKANIRPKIRERVECFIFLL